MTEFTLTTIKGAARPTRVGMIVRADTALAVATGDPTLHTVRATVTPGTLAASRGWTWLVAVTLDGREQAAGMVTERGVGRFQMQTRRWGRSFGDGPAWSDPITERMTFAAAVEQVAHAATTGYIAEAPAAVPAA